MPYPYDPDSFGFLVNDVARMIRAEMDRNIAAAGLGLTPAEGRTLSHVARAGAVRQNVLAERIGVEAMTVSSSLDRLEAQSLVERRTDPEDRRAKLVEVTEAGHAVLAKIQPISAALRAAVSRGVAPDEWEMLIDTLKRARANMVTLRGEASKESAAA